MSEKLILSSGSLGYSVYDVESKTITLAHSRGKLSYQNTGVIIGDKVSLDDRGFIHQILPRKNLLTRPRLANVDFVFVIVSAKEPLFSSFLLDKFLTLINFSEIKVKIIISKCDLLSDEEFSVLKKRMSYYEKEDYEVFYVSRIDDSSIVDLKNKISSSKVAFVGQTGVGKSTILNRLCPDFNRKVDSLFVSSGRGRHTTKEVVMLPYQDGFLYDTPGFSQLELKDINPDGLSISFPGYEKYVGKCQFSDCLHLPFSKGCELKNALENDELSQDSYENYCKIYEEVKENDLWKKK